MMRRLWYWRITCSCCCCCCSQWRPSPASQAAAAAAAATAAAVVVEATDSKRGWLAVSQLRMGWDQKLSLKLRLRLCESFRPVRPVSQARALLFTQKRQLVRCPTSHVSSCSRSPTPPQHANLTKNANCKKTKEKLLSVLLHCLK